MQRLQNLQNMQNSQKLQTIYAKNANTPNIQKFKICTHTTLLKNTHSRSYIINLSLFVQGRTLSTLRHPLLTNSNKTTEPFTPALFLVNYYSKPFSANHLSASRAAAQPVPAAVMA